MNATERSTLYFDPDQNAVVDRADGSILPLDVLGSGVQSLPEHVQAQIQCKQDEDYARSLSGGGPKLLGNDDLYASVDIESRPPRSTRSGGYLSPSHQKTGETSLEQEIIEMHALYPGGDGPADCAAEERPRDADWTLARALQSLEFEIVQDTHHDPLAEDFNEKEYRASSCKRQLVTFSTFVCLVQVSPVIPLSPTLIFRSCQSRRTVRVFSDRTPRRNGSGRRIRAQGRESSLRPARHYYGKCPVHPYEVAHGPDLPPPLRCGTEPSKRV